MCQKMSWWGIRLPWLKRALAGVRKKKKTKVELMPSGERTGNKGGLEAHCEVIQEEN